MSLSIRQTTGEKPPRVSFALIKDAALGKSFEVSLVFCGAALAKSLNRRYRGKEYVPNVLSFPITDSSGEIFICLAKARAEHAKFGMSFEKYVAYLFIHGCLHLKGHEHGATMEFEEQRLLRKNTPKNGATHRSWH